MVKDRKPLVPILLIFLISFSVYIASLGNQFLWDDETQIVGNTVIHNLKNLPSLFTGGVVYTQGQTLTGGFYRPIVTITHLLLWQISSSPFIFRLFQIIVHSLNSVLVYLIFNKLLSKRYEKNISQTVSFFSGLIFGVHPAISEGVLFISGLGEPLFTLFCLVSFWFFLKAEKSSDFLISSLFFLLALLTKETATVLILIFIIYLKIDRSLKKSFKQLTAPLIAFFMYLVLRLIFIKATFAGLNFPAPIAQASLITRLTTIPYEICHYLMLSIFPNRLSISQHQVITNITDIRFWGSALIIISLTIGTFFFLRKTKLSLPELKARGFFTERGETPYRKPQETFIRHCFKNTGLPGTGAKLIVFFILWFLLGLLPALNIFPLSATIAERWLYFPLIGLLGMVSIFLIESRRLIKLKTNLLKVIFGLILLILSTRTIIRTLNWQNGLKLYAHDLKINPDSFELQNNYGVELVRLGEIDRAGEYFKKSIAFAPNWWTNYNNLGVVVERKGDYQNAQKYYQQSINKGNYYLAFENLAKLYLKTKDYSKANDFLKDATASFPSSPILHIYCAIGLYQDGKEEEALREAKIAFNLEPTEENYLLFQKILNKEKLQW